MKKDITSNVNLIKKMVQRRDLSLQNLSSTASQLSSDIIPDIAQRQKSFSDSYLKYLDILQKYQEDKAITPLDVFPGIHTSAASLNTDEYKKDSAEMKQLADVISHQLDSLVSSEAFLIDLTKKLLRDTKIMLDRADEARDALSALMKELDSAYDIGYLSKNT